MALKQSITIIKKQFKVMQKTSKKAGQNTPTYAADNNTPTEFNINLLATVVIPESKHPEFAFYFSLGVIAGVLCLPENSRLSVLRKDNTLYYPCNDKTAVTKIQDATNKNMPDLDFILDNALISLGDASAADKEYVCKEFCTALLDREDLLSDFATAITIRNI